MSKKIIYLFILFNKCLHCAEISIAQEIKADAAEQTNSLALTMVTGKKSPVRPPIKINRLPLASAHAINGAGVVDLAQEALELGLRPNSPAVVRSYESHSVSENISGDNDPQPALRSATSNSDTQNIPGMADAADVKLDENTIGSIANAYSDYDREHVRSYGEPREIVASNSLSEFAAGNLEITSATASDITDEESLTINTERASPSDRKPQTWAILNQNNQDELRINSNKKAKIILAISLVVSAIVVGVIIWHKLKENKEKDNGSKNNSHNPNNSDNKKNLVIAHE